MTSLEAIKKRGAISPRSPLILVNQTKEILRDFTRFAIISKPNIQITQNKNPVEANYIAYHIIVTFQNWHTSFPEKKNVHLMMHFYWHTLYKAYGIS